HPLVRSWTFLDLKKPEQLRLAAAMLAVAAPEPPRDVEEMLNEALKQPLNELVETQLLRALFPLHINAKHYDKAEAALEALVKKHELRGELLGYKLGLLLLQDKRAAALEFVETQRKRNPAFAADSEAAILGEDGDYAKADALWGERV